MIAAARSHTPITAGDRLVEIAPNRFVQLDLGFTVPETVICDVVSVEGQSGTFRLVPRSWETLERVTPELSRKLGLSKRTDTLRRLIRAGFVDGARIAPKIYSLNLASYFAHVKRCAEDPDYWERKDVLKQFKEGGYF